MEDDEDEADDGGVRLVVAVFLTGAGGGGGVTEVGLTFSKKLKSLRSGNRTWSGISTILAVTLLGCCFLVCFCTSHFQLLA